MGIISVGGKVLTIGGGVASRAASGGGGGGDAANTMTLREAASTTTSNYPVQFARPFAEGEIADYPEVLVDGVAVTTQANVQTRWGDGSVKHAILSFLIPTLTADDTVTLTFQNQASGNTSGAVSKASMLADYDFEATIALTNGSTQTLSARTMLSADAYTTWASGSVCTTVIIADHSSARTYDVGFDAYAPFRPIFHATFWPTINKVRVRFIGETASTEEWEGITYSLALTTGNASPSSRYTKSSWTQRAGTRWTKEFWVQTAPSAIAINHNLAYLNTTNHLPKWDTTLAIPEATLAAQSAAWLGASTDIGDGGNWQKAMGTAGGRQDIGLLPAWSVRWLYSGDNRLKAMAFGNADLAAAGWQMHAREGDSAKHIDRALSVSGLGKIMSLRERPTAFMHSSHFNSGTDAADQITVPSGGTGIDESTGWYYDAEHVPEPFYPQYLLTGDFWYLEELWFWASWAAGTENPGHRGPTGAYGHCHFDSGTRATAWVLRSRMYAAIASPDGTDEKTYFTELVDDAAAGFEGMHNTTASYATTPWSAMWTWARAEGHMGGALDAAGGIPPQHQWDAGLASTVQAGYGIDETKVSFATGYFMDLYLMAVLGVGKRLGFPLAATVTYFSKFFVEQVTTDGYNPKHIARGRMPENAGVKNGARGAYFATWEDLEAAFLTSWYVADWDLTVTTDENFDVQLTDAENGYAFLALAALAVCYSETSGAAAWTWAVANIASDPSDVLNANPKWALVP